MTRSNPLKLLATIGSVLLIAAACAGPAASPTTKPATQAPTTQAPATQAATQAPATAAASPTGSYTLGYSNAFGLGNGFREEQLCTAKAQALVSGQVSSGTWIHQEDATYPQLQQMRDLIAEDPDAIIFNPNSPEALNQVIDEAQAAGIMTISIDAYVTDPETLNLSNDQENYGYIGASWLFDRLGGEGNVYYMRGIVGHPADLDRHAGVMRALTENPNIKLLPSNDGVGTDWLPAKGTELANGIINDGTYDTIDGIWTSGIDQQVVDAIKAAGKPFVPIVGADLKGFVSRLLNKGGGYEDLEGIAVYNPASVGGAGVTLALMALNNEQIETTTVKRTTPDGVEHDIAGVFLPKPLSSDNVSDAGKAALEQIYIEGLNDLWPVSWQIEGWTDYGFGQMIECKGPGE